MLNKVDEGYLKVLDFLTNDINEFRPTRTGIRSLSAFGAAVSYDLSSGLPLLNSKKIHVKSVIEELLWFISGSTNVKDLQAKGVTIWDEWADPVTGELNEIYGKQWSRYEDIRMLTPDQHTEFLKSGKMKDFEFCGQLRVKDGNRIVVRREVNQIDRLIESISTDPYGRRHVLNSWNVGTVDEAALAPCHVLYQFYVTNDDRLCSQMYQRSADWFLGVPFNLASLAFLTHMLATQTGYKVGTMSTCYGDFHIYENQLEQAKEQLSREGWGDLPTPKLHLKHRESIHDYVLEDFVIEGYDPLPVIKAPVAV